MRVILTGLLTSFLMLFAGYGDMKVRASDNALKDMNVTEAAAAIRDGKITSVALTEALLTMAEEFSGLNAFITLDRDLALAAAKAADQARADGAELGPLHGVPLVVKDNFNTFDMVTTGGTPVLAAFQPSEDAPVVARLRAAGAIILGKTNLHELAFGITSNNAHYGAVGNAYDPSRIAGGSSGGTAAAVGARIAPGGLGTDTGGSARIPPALNGVIGFRPTVGRYPQAGIIPISGTRDTAGPIARTMNDIVLMDNVITRQSGGIDAVNLKTIRLGVPSQFNDDLEAETKRIIDAALKKLQDAGVTLVPVDAANIMELAAKVGFPLALYEVRGALSDYLEQHETGLTIEALAEKIASPDVNFVFTNLVLGEQAVPEAVYLDALHNSRPLLQAAYAEVFSKLKLDGLIFPTTPLPAQPRATSDMNVMLNGKEVPTFQTYIRNTDPGSNAGIPGLTIPAGLTSQGLPVGIEVDAPAHSDRHLLAIGMALEAVIGQLPAPK